MRCLFSQGDQQLSEMKLLEKEFIIIEKQIKSSRTSCMPLGCNQAIT